MFWDSSALVPLLLAEERSLQVTSLQGRDRAAVAWWASTIECRSALSRRRREHTLSEAELDRALSRLAFLAADLDQVAPTAKVRAGAGRALAAHPLRAADALQLAAALVWCDDTPVGEAFVCLDDRLRDAARAEGFAVLPLAEAI